MENFDDWDEAEGVRARARGAGSWDEVDSETWRCRICKMLCGSESARASHVCYPPASTGMRLYFHEEQDHWPFYSKGHHPVSARMFAEWFKDLPPHFQEEFRQAIGSTSQSQPSVPVPRDS